MAFWSKWFGNSYDDDKLVDAVHTALTDDPLIKDHSKIAVDSEDGVITLTGKVEKQIEKDHVEGTVRDALRYQKLKFERIVNNLRIEAAETVA
jgi:osmotically-inducible protein OsmY